ncbi:MAG: prolyl-tRNA synthetase associated domain-containing protein [Pseudomonadota bacterium]
MNQAQAVWQEKSLLLEQGSIKAFKTGAMDAERRFFARLEEMGIAADTVEHDATPTVETSQHLAQSLPGGRSKSLLVTDKDKRLFLITARGSTRVDLKKVGEAVGARGRLSFAAPTLMQSVLGVEPGHLTPYALINDKARDIDTVVLDQELMGEPMIWAHPLRNTASTAVSAEALKAFVSLHAQRVIELSLAAG